MSSIVGGLELPFFPQGTAPTVTNFTLNQTTDQLEVIFQAFEDATITRLGLRQGTVTGTAPSYKISLQGFDASGLPDGTIKGGGSPASTTFTPVAGGNNTWAWKTLDNSFAVTRGSFYAWVIAYNSGTIDGSNNCSFGSFSSVGVSPGLPFPIQNDAGSRTKQAGTPIFGYGSTGVAYGTPGNAFSASNFNSGSTPDEKASLINIPTTWCSTYKIVGAAWYGSSAAGTAYDLKLYDTDGTTVLQSINLDTDADEATGGRRRMVFFDESSLSSLVAGSSYRLAIVPGGTNIALAAFSVGATADLDAYAGGASICQGSTRADAGSWTNDNLTRYGINPILADITAPSSGGGGAIIGSPIVRGI